MSVTIIAEAGVNHNGNIAIAKKLIDVAAEAGVDYVKFQTFNADTLVKKDSQKAEYQLENTGKNDTQYAMLKELELSKEDHEILIDHCNIRKVKFLSTGFDLDSIDFLANGKIDFIKIPSGEITNYPYLKKCAGKKLPLVLSTGMSSLQDVKNALDVMLNHGSTHDKITVLHCNTEYPTPMQDVNLLAMLTIKEEFGVKIGYSDHTLGIEVPIAATALGACVIEKHFTLSREMKGPDHIASLEPHELIDMVKAIRNIEQALGSGIKAPTESEKKNIDVVRKSIVAIKRIGKGEKFDETNIGVKRPGTGISPMKWEELIGQISSKSYNPDDLI